MSKELTGDTVFGEVYWTLNDITEHAGTLGVSIPLEDAHDMAEAIDQDIRDAMIQAGWEVVYEAVESYRKEHK